MNPLKAPDRRAVKADSLFENVFLQLTEGNRKVLPDTRKIDEAEIDDLHPLVASERQDTHRVDVCLRNRYHGRITRSSPTPSARMTCSRHAQRRPVPILCITTRLFYVRGAGSFDQYFVRLSQVKRGNTVSSRARRLASRRSGRIGSAATEVGRRPNVLSLPFWN